MASTKNRGCRPGTRPAFSLLELIVVLFLSVVILAVYIRAMDEAETVEFEMRTDSLPRLARSGGPRAVDPLAAVAETPGDGLAEAEPVEEGAALIAPPPVSDGQITGADSSDQ